MRIFFTKSLSLLIIGVIFLGITACSDNDSSGGGGSSGPRMPANAIKLTPSNAQRTKEIALPSHVQLVDIAAGNPDSVTLVNTCVTTTGDDFSITYVGKTQYTLKNCPTYLGNNYQMSGSLTYTYNESDPDNPAAFNGDNLNNDYYTLRGSLIFTDPNNPGDVIEMTDLQFDGVGEYTGTTESKFTLTLAFAISSTLEGGFIVTTPMGIVWDAPTDKTSGEILIQGAENTRIKFDFATPLQSFIDEGSGTFVPL